MFRLLRLKPPNGWNAVAWELVIVTLGVLLALGAQQAAETFNGRRQAAETRRALTAEIEETLAILQLRNAAQPCIDRRLGELRSIVDEWGRTGRFRTPRWVSQATWFAINTARFEAAQSAGRLALLPSEEQYRFGVVVSSFRNLWEIQREEMNAWAKLRMLQSGPDALSESDRAVIRTGLQEASLLNYRAKIVLGQTIPLAAGYGWHPKMTRVRQFMPRAWKGGRFMPSSCLSIDTPPNEANRLANQIYPLPE